MKKAIWIGLTALWMMIPDAVWAQGAPDFELTDASGVERRLADYRGKIVVLEWFNPDCPFVRKHYDSGNMQGLQKEYGAKGVVWLAVNSSAPGKQGHYSAERHAAIMKERGGAPAAILLDPDGRMGRAYGAKTTPHLFVIDANGELAYRGAIDDRPSADPADVTGARNFVREALDALLSGGSVPTVETSSYGCSVKY